MNRCLLVAAHPDDETVGAGIWMKRHGSSGLSVLHITNGSPRNPGDARAAGFSTREQYAAARRQELYQALRLIGVTPEQCRKFPFVDQEAHLALPELIAQMRSLIEELSPELVLSPAYEGGHPDHDAAAFAVAMARLQVGGGFRHCEYRLYHAAPDGAIATREFLNPEPSRTEVVSLSPEERELKSRMISCFRTQGNILSNFDFTDEQIRDAPAYDFTVAPHPGPLLYERWGWRISGEDWRRCAQQANRPHKQN